jgi:hypothetical protein
LEVLGAKVHGGLLYISAHFGNCLKLTLTSRELVAHASNPSYSGGRDQEDHGSKSDWANSAQDPISKKPITKKGPVEWLIVQALSSSPSTAKKKKKIYHNKSLNSSKDRHKPIGWR